LQNSKIERIIICYDSVEKVTEFSNQGLNDFTLFYSDFSQNLSPLCYLWRIQYFFSNTIQMKNITIILLVLMLTSCNKAVFKSAWIHEKAPENFVTRFETSKGNFDITVDRAASPFAVDRFYQLVNHHLLDSVLIYRVVPKFVVQFGITDSLKTNPWKKFKVLDEKVVKSNIKGSLSFARSIKDSRDFDLFINLENNTRLDTVNYEKVVGFPAFGTVTKGMEVVETFYSGYGNEIMDKYDSLASNRKQFLKMFPKLDVIRKVYILKEK
jgi:peptidyl-prolyl cis-trans isomerase A (cyclophilin A)